MMKRSPGPWRLSRSIYSDRISIDDANGDAVVEAVDEGFADEGPDPVLKVSDADAALIAEAPEMLKAIRGMLAEADRRTTPFDLARAILARIDG